jgi:hypothetical protein
VIYKTLPKFSPFANGLRNHFDQRFEDPRRATQDRFVWDYWHVPEQYTLLRTPAYQYFPPTLYKKFHMHLVNWGREHLGCHDISPTWLSSYVEGCFQGLHQDEPHGPLAFVLSLTNWSKREFSGGETLILKDRESSSGFREQRQIFHYIAPQFNQLAVFDPSLTHGVNEVRGVRDPRQSRLVLHGWFLQPRVFWQGGLRAPQVGRVLDEQLPAILEHFPEMNGFISLRLQITKTGKVTAIKKLFETINNPREERTLIRALLALSFPKTKSGAKLTLPMVFK